MSVLSAIENAIRSGDYALVRAGTELVRAHPALHEFLLGWQWATQPWRVYLVAVPVVGVAVWRGRRRLPADEAGRLARRGRCAIAAMMATWAIAAVVKELIRRPRPFVEHPLAHAAGNSFPSGHSANSMAAGLSLVLFTWPYLGRGGRIAATLAAAGFVLTTGANRVLLGMHFPTDVVGGFLLAALIVTLTYRAYRPT